uniref:Uncharacterized protein n=1 Tax=Rhizophora mucronata TaxID=61149 RepID=A0A2P2PJJ7_RHIMU
MKPKFSFIYLNEILIVQPMSSSSQVLGLFLGLKGSSSSSSQSPLTKKIEKDISIVHLVQLYRQLQLCPAKQNFTVLILN